MWLPRDHLAAYVSGLESTQARGSAREPADYEEARCVIIVVVDMNFDIGFGFAVSCARNKNTTCVYTVVCDELKKRKLVFARSNLSASHEQRLMFVFSTPA